MDIAHKETEELLKEMETQISEVYRQAEQDVQRKLNDYLRKFATKDAIKQKQVEQGVITQAEYDRWRVGQIAMGQRWQEMRDTLAQDYVNADRIAQSVIGGYMPEVYALNHNYGTYEVESGTGVDTSYTLYDRQSVERLLRDNPDMLPPPGRKVSQAIREGRAVRWNEKQIQSVMMQGLLQGEAMGAIASRLARAVGDSDRKAAIRNARTMTTGAENAGRVDSYKRAESMGIELQQQWVATLDGRTRHSHRLLDGESVEVGKRFSNGCRFPGDPEGLPGEVWNCRCTLIADLKGYEDDPSDLGLRNTNKLKGMSYEEWKKGHGVSERITKPDEMQARARQDAINELKRNQNTVEDIDRRIQEWEAFSNNSMSLDDWAKAEQEIEKLQEQRKQLLAEEAKRIEAEQKEKIKSRMIDNGLFDNGSTWIAQYDFDNISAANLAEAEKAYSQVFDRYPQLKGKFAGIEAWDNTNPANAMASTNPYGGIISFNPDYWTTNRIAEEVRTNFERDCLASGSVEGAVLHEIGHAIDAYSGNRWDVGDNRTRMFTGKPRTTSKQFMRKVYRQAGISQDEVGNYVSLYSTYSDEEAFAECFAAYMTGSKDNKLVEAFGTQFEALMKGL